MPLYEVVLRHPNGSEEVRFHDRAIAVGDRLLMNNRMWEVVLERRPVDLQATARFLCELTTEQRGRALAAKEKDAEMRERIASLRKRMERPRRTH